MPAASKKLVWALLWAGYAAAGPLEFRTRELPRAALGTAYHAVVATQVDGRCPTSDVLLEIAGGSLPRGMALAGDALTGVPREFGVFQIRVRAANPCAWAVEDLTLEVTGKPILRVAPEELVVEYRDGDPLPQPRVILVSGSWADMPYAVQAANAPWLRLHAGQGVTPSAGSPYMADPVTVQVMPEGLAPGVYRTVVSFTTEWGANHPQIPVTFRVLAK
jgi:hypothetical protein